MGMLCCRYGRAQVIGGFINGLFLIFIAVFVVVEAIEVSGWVVRTLHW